MPILGIMASQISGHLYDGPYGAYDSLATVTLSASTASITFAGIPSGYKHLQIRAIAPVGNYITGKLQFNGDTGSNYARHTLLGNGGGTAQATSATSQTYISIASDNGFGSASYPYAMIWDILDYGNVNKYNPIFTGGVFFSLSIYQLYISYEQRTKSNGV